MKEIGTGRQGTMQNVVECFSQPFRNCTEFNTEHLLSARTPTRRYGHNDKWAVIPACRV